MKDTQLIEFAGRNWLAAQLQRAGIEVARPERDRGIDLIAYVDLDRRASRFLARPIQLKVASAEGFRLDPKYSKFPDLLLAYVWHMDEPSRTVCYALTYAEALRVAEEMGWTETESWRSGRGYTVTRVSRRLRALLEGYEMTADQWWKKLGADGTCL